MYLYVQAKKLIAVVVAVVALLNGVYDTGKFLRLRSTLRFSSC